MLSFKKLTAVAAITASVAALAVVPAMADPITGSGKPVTPKLTDIVGTGSDTIQSLLDQFSLDYNATHKGRKLYSWDATNPKTGAIGDSIKLKTGCPQFLPKSPYPRPDGSSAGILALTTSPFGTMKVNGKKVKVPCLDYARASRGRAPTDPPKAKGGIVFVALAKDAVTWATNRVSDAPKNLSTAQLAAIYTCTITNWDEVGGKNAPINVQLPQTGSGTRAFFLKEIGVATPGSCVDSSKNESPNNLPEENEGVNKYLQGPNVIYPYSVGKYLSEVFHSAKCLNKSCTANSAGLTCKPTKKQNRFGCDTHGSMVLHELNRTFPTTGTGAKSTINPNFSHNFIRLVYVVVRWAATKDNIPAYLEPLFASARAKVKGWACTNSVARRDMIDYGFLPTPFCGTGS